MPMWLDGNSAQAFRELTTPSLASCLPAVCHPGARYFFTEQVHLAAAGLLFAGQPVGLMVLRCNGRESAELISIVVKRPFRGLGLGKEMMEWAISELRRMGIIRLLVSYALERESTAAMERLTQTEGKWSYSRGLRLIHFGRHGAQKMLNSMEPAIKRLEKCNRYDITPWRDLKAPEIHELGMSQGAPFWAWPCKEENNEPFAMIDKDVSGLLTVDGNPGGWIISHRVGENLLRISTWWVVPQITGSGASLRLLARSINKFLEPDSGYSNGSFGVTPENTVMLRLCKNKIEPFATGITCNTSGCLCLQPIT